MEGRHTLVVVLQARDQVCFVARLGQTALLEKLLQVRDLKRRVVRHLVDFGHPLGLLFAVERLVHLVSRRGRSRREKRLARLILSGLRRWRG